ncbi:riboflavin synthase [Limnoglobus roseus]|uniref:Riboflavin synthase n=1 Tax=Limnoglobus roseus TaxID=2598579 RepID=A0A5C1AK81_9BACT|nr:riboflavin synthase [Limnoglobus roseus]QEL19799.1 riboflavin synthase subunit alpha [Limnoglobus roseus]
MFTGLVQSLARVVHLKEDGDGGRVLTISRPETMAKIDLGESIAVNGCCLTVAAFFEDALQFQAGPETLLKTNLGQLAVGDAVNLEQALRVGDRLGGHFVTGHIDGVGQVVRKEQQGEWLMIEFASPPTFDELMVNKGSIAVDGISLTIVETTPGRFRVMVIPHTRDHTTLGLKAVGASVNLELDLLAKHVQKLLANLNVTI